MAASAIYIIIDIYDVKIDRKYPVRCCRPIASGQVNIREEVFAASFLLCTMGVFVV